MSSVQKSQKYRDAIDALVLSCNDGQGQIAPTRVISGVWNENASPDFIPEQHAINQLLKKLSIEDREIIATMLAESFAAGVFDSLVMLEEFEMQPFETGYEGGPAQDFIGRLQGWEWPC